jgi:hypothetical protein
MADNSTASLATALLGLHRKRDPLEIFQSFGKQQLAAGSSTAPLGSGNALEGVARALQGGIGGLVNGYTMGKQEEQGQNNISALTAMLGAKDPAGLAEAAKGFKGDTDVIAPILAQLVSQRMNQFKRQGDGDAFEGAVGGQPSTAPVQPAAASGGSPAPAASGGITRNNVGNITNGQGGFRQYATPQAGATDLVSLLQSYPVQYNQGQPMTLTQIGAKYAPADNGKDPMLKGNDPAVWARNVGQIAGVDPNQPLDFDNPAVVTAVVRGINAQEKGAAKQPPDVLQQGVASGMDPAANPQPLTINMPGPKLPQQGDQPAADGSGTPMPPSATSGPPDVARPQPSAEQITKYKKLIADGVLSGPQAVQELDKEITGQWGLAKQQALEVWKDQQASKRQNEKAAIDLGQKAPMELITKRVDNYENKLRPAAVSAANDINAIHSVRQILDAGAFTGTGAEAKTMLGKLGEQFGIPSDEAVNTQVLGAVLAKRVLAAAGGTLGTGFSNADRDFVERASGGQISMDEAAMRKLADIGERDARLRIAQHDQEVGRLKKLPGIGQLGDDQFTIPTAPTYAEFNKANRWRGRPPLRQPRRAAKSQRWRRRKRRASSRRARSSVIPTASCVWCPDGWMG